MVYLLSDSQASELGVPGETLDTGTQCGQTRIRRGEFSGVMTTTRILMRSQFHIPSVPRLQPGQGAQTEI